MEAPPEVVVHARQPRDEVLLLLLHAGEYRLRLPHGLGTVFQPGVRAVRQKPHAREYGIQPLVHDPLATAEEAMHEYGIRLSAMEDLRALDALVLAVSHRAYLDVPLERLLAPVRDGGVFVDVKSVVVPDKVGRRIRYWSL